jgi:glycosyltransferase involved in cell wall biosynthesis
MKRSRFISIVIPTHNSARYVGEAIESALGQTWKELEVIVVDDASSDETLTVVERFGSAVRVEKMSENGGPSAARNRGISVARGEFVQFLDSDDILRREKIELCATAMQGAANDTVAFCEQGTFFDFDGARQYRWPDSTHGFDSDRQVESLLRFGVGVARPLHRTSLLQGVGGFAEDLRVLEDFDLNVRLALNGARFFRRSDRLVLCREHDGPRQRRSVGSARGRLQGELRVLTKVILAGQFRAGMKRVFASRLAYCARRAFSDGDASTGTEAYALAVSLSRFPRASNSLPFDLMSWVLGLERAERLVRATFGRQSLLSVTS